MVKGSTPDRSVEFVQSIVVISNVIRRDLDWGAQHSRTSAIRFFCERESYFFLPLERRGAIRFFMPVVAASAMTSSSFVRVIMYPA